MSKKALYGSLDPTTREWTDSLFTHILRKILDSTLAPEAIYRGGEHTFFNLQV
jgi:hypothetical protein